MISQPNSRHFAGHKSGFTLIELLVVIAIIAILAAILFPVFARARENARRSSCQSNMKQIALGVKQYTQDYDEMFPLAVTTVSATSTRTRGMFDSIQPYVKSTQILQCPSDTVEGDSDPNSNQYTDYWYNAALSWNNQISGAQLYNVGVSEAVLLNSALTVMVGDGAMDGSARRGWASLRTLGCAVSGNLTADEPGVGGTATVVDTAGCSTGLGGGGQRHFEGINLAFTDGHVKWIKSDGADANGKIWVGRAGFAASGQNPTFNTRRN